MNRLHISIESLPDELKTGMVFLKDDYPISEERTGFAPSARSVVFEKGDRIAVSSVNGLTTVTYVEPIHAFRCVGRLLGDPLPGDTAIEFEEKQLFPFIGLMLDCSRNAVHTVTGVKRLVRRMALMGLNALCLYTEDTYEIPGEPFFGYGRGPYTEAELKELDDYATHFDIEMFPCIQALAHLEQIIQWKAYQDVSDTKGILLAGDDGTYALIEKMITAAMKPFRSKRIHLGMDEAHGLGTGNYKKINGEVRSFDIMNKHLERVLEITREKGLDPMMWSDMWFRLGSKEDSYYDRDSVIPQDVIDMIPKDVTQVYWDYYNTDEDFYREWITRHRALGSEPLVAPGAWTWGRLWAYYPHAFATCEPCMKVSKEMGVKELLMTMWGDDGSECDFMSALPVLQFFADHAYNETVDEEMTQNNFHGVTGSDYDAWIAAGRIDAVSTLRDAGEFHPNTSKFLLWEDPLLGLCQPMLEGHSYTDEYAELEATLEETAHGNGLMDHHLELPRQVARVLSIKADLPSRLRAAYEEGRRDDIDTMLSDDLPVLAAEVKTLWQIHRKMWYYQHKPQGWEVVEGRYGRLMNRIDTARWRLQAYLSGEIESLPELEEIREKIYDHNPELLPDMNYARAFTASNIK